MKIYIRVTNIKLDLRNSIYVLEGDTVKFIRGEMIITGPSHEFFLNDPDYYKEIVQHGILY